MPTEKIIDSLGRIVGRIYDDGRHRTGRDELGRVVGRYDKEEDRTRNPLGQTITKSGDVLGGLILNRGKK